MLYSAILAISRTIDLPSMRVGGEFYRQMNFLVSCITTGRDWLQFQFNPPEKTEQILWLNSNIIIDYHK